MKNLLQYLNQAQAYMLALNTKNMTMVGGRGIGKGLIAASILRRNSEGMPGSNTALVGPNSKECGRTLFLHGISIFVDGDL